MNARTTNPAQDAVLTDEGSGVFTDPVFVLCNGRSGSTLLRFLPDAHPELTCPPETSCSPSKKPTPGSPAASASGPDLREPGAGIGEPQKARSPATHCGAWAAGMGRGADPLSWALTLVATPQPRY